MQLSIMYKYIDVIALKVKEIIYSICYIFDLREQILLCTTVIVNLES